MKNYKLKNIPCVLCGKMGNNARGHVVSGWALEMGDNLNNVKIYDVEKTKPENIELTVFNNGNGHAYIPKKNPPVGIPAEPYSLQFTSYILCREESNITLMGNQGCDNYLGSGENEIKKVFLEGENCETEGAFPSVIVHPKNRKMVVRGIVSALYKAFVSENDVFSIHFDKAHPIVGSLKRAALDDEYASKIIDFFVVKWYGVLADGKFCNNSTDVYSKHLDTPWWKDTFTMQFGGMLFYIRVDLEGDNSKKPVKVFAQHSTYSNVCNYGIPFFMAIDSKFDGIDLRNPIRKNLFEIFNEFDYQEKFLLPRSWIFDSYESYASNLESTCICGGTGRVFEKCCGKFWGFKAEA